LNNLLNSYKGKKVFLTGHTGFKGSWLNLILTKIGAHVKGYSLEPDELSLYNKLKDNLSGESVFADINDFEKLKTEIRKFEPDYIFHLAAQPLVRESYKNPLYTLNTNIIGTANLLQSLQGMGKKCNIVIITTDKVYDNKEWIYPYRENDRLGGYDIYSSSKAAAELIVSSFRNSFFNPDNYDSHKIAIATARAGNVIGGGDYAADRIVPDMVKSFLNNQTLIIRNPNSTRPWQHVIEPLTGYLKLGLALDNDPVHFSGSYNFGPLNDDILTVKELVETSIKCLQRGNFTVLNENEPHEANLLKLDISKAINELGWKPKYNSAAAIKITLDWYLKVEESHESAYKCCLADIDEYFRID
jgi:CDP-glucose 4,6-dehydratase